MFNLDGKTALITGATGGIGSAIARALHSQGAKVILSGTRQGSLDELAHELSDRAHPIAADLSDKGSIDSLIKQISDISTDGVDIVINNAGIVRDNLLVRMKDEEWNQVLDINLFAGYKLIQGLMRGMMKRRWGRIIGISSVVGTTGNPGQANYAAAKAGVEAFTKSLAKEVGKRDITINAVAPGFISTDMTENNKGVNADYLVKEIPLGRFGKPEEVADATTFLCSKAASYINGINLPVDGGFTKTL